MYAQQAMRINFLQLKGSMCKRESLRKVIRERIEDIPTRVSTDIAHVVETLSFDLDGSGKTLDCKLAEFIGLQVALGIVQIFCTS